MPRGKKFTAEQIIGKLREAEVELARGKTVPELAQAVRDKLHLAAQSFGRSAKDRKKVYRADLYPKVLIRPICGGCGQPMILGRSIGKYQSFCCHNALHGMKGCKCPARGTGAAAGPIHEETRAGDHE